MMILTPTATRHLQINSGKLPYDMGSGTTDGNSIIGEALAVEISSSSEHDNERNATTHEQRTYPRTK